MCGLYTPVDDLQSLCFDTYDNFAENVCVRIVPDRSDTHTILEFWGPLLGHFALTETLT